VIETTWVVCDLKFRLAGRGGEIKHGRVAVAVLAWWS